MNEYPDSRQNQGVEEHPYACPNCKGNRVNFTLLYRQSVAHPVVKDARSGAVVDELGPPEYEAAEGPVVDVRCRSCGYVGHESEFLAAARRNLPPF